MLAVSGELNPAIGGIPVRPEINLEAALQPRQIMGTYAPAYQPSPRPEQRHRRSVYAFQIRGLRDPFLEGLQPAEPGGPPARAATPRPSPRRPSPCSTAESLLTAPSPWPPACWSETDARPDALRRAFPLPPAATAEEDRACLDHWEAMTARHARLTFTPQAPPPRSSARRSRSSAASRSPSPRPWRSTATSSPTSSPPTPTPRPAA